MPNGETRPLRLRTKSILAKHLWMLMLAVVVICIGLQLFIPPFIGLANNGDFGRVISRFAFAPARG
jgi:hypothetical protein